MKWLTFALRNVGRNRRRSMMTILLTAVGTLGILSTGGFALYTYDSLKEFSARTTGHAIVTHAEYFMRDEEMPMELGLDNADDIKNRFQKLPEVRTIVTSIEFTGLISNGEKSTIYMAKGVEPKFFNQTGPTMQLKQGKFLSRKLDSTEEPQVMLGEGLARSLKAEIGTSLTLLSTTSDGALNAMDVAVRGIFSTGVPDVDDRFAYVHLQNAQELLLTDKVSQIALYFKELNKTDQFVERLKKTYPELAVSHWQDRAFFYKGVKNLYDRIFGVMGVVIMMMIGFAIFNTMAMAVIERTREIGTLRAMGSFPFEIKKVFLLEALIISLAGVFVGIILDLILVLGLIFFDVQMPPPPGQSSGYPLRVNFSLDLVLAVVAVMVVLAQISAWFASNKGTRKPITEALAYV